MMHFAFAVFLQADFVLKQVLMKNEIRTIYATLQGVKSGIYGDVCVCVCVCAFLAEKGLFEVHTPYTFFI